MRVAALIVLTLAASTAGAEPAVTFADALRAESDIAAALAHRPSTGLGPALAEAARVPWPLLSPTTDAVVGAHLRELDPAARRKWALDRALPILAGQLPTTDESTREILSEVAAATGIDRRNRDMLHMDEARQAYSARQLAVAQARYSKVTQGSPLWPDALREKAWTLLLLGRPSDSLGATVALGAPYFPQEDHAEGRLLRATVLLERCRYDEARELVAVLADTPVPELDDTTAQLAISAGTPPPGAVAARAWASPLVDRVRSAIPASGSVSDHLALERRDGLVRLGARLLHDAFTIEADQLRQIKTRALKVRYEAFRQQRQILERGETLAVPRPTPPEVLGDDDVAWTFDGTYWRDELDSYRYAAGDACPHAAGQP